MEKNKSKKKPKKIDDKSSEKDKNFVEIVKIMANTPPVNNETLKRRKKRQS